jgi:hypothetical protein
MALRRKGRLKASMKRLGLSITGLSFLFILSCSNGTSSTASSAGSSGTATGWMISIQIGTNPINLGETSSVLAIVKDRTGAPAPQGTNICFTAVRNSMLTPGTKVDPTNLLKTVCETTTNNIGQSMQTYAALVTTGVDTIQVSSQGVITNATITVN